MYFLIRNMYNNRLRTFKLCIMVLTAVSMIAFLVFGKFSKKELYDGNHKMLYVMEKWHRIILSLGLNCTLIEPYMVFSALSSEHQNLLLKRNFNDTNYMVSDRVVTFSVLGKDVPELEKGTSLFAFHRAGFKPVPIEEPIASWMKHQNSTEEDQDIFISHIFYIYEEFCVHAVVFYERGSYFWHSALGPQKDKKIPPMTELLFTKYNSAYENFACFNSSCGKAMVNFNMPLMPYYFLFQIESSRFLECDLSRSKEFNSAKNLTNKYKYHSRKNFVDKTIIALNYLKAFFSPLLMNIWIFSGTMLGWYRQCDLIPYTTDIDFTVWANEVEDVNYIINEFNTSKILKLKERMGFLDRALEFNLRCNGLRVDLFFMYQEQNGTWYGGHRPSKHYYVKYYHTNFTLCSAELLGHKVQVPCETEKIILKEYGPKWNKPVESWNYLSSIFNRGPNIYWEKEVSDKAYEEFKV